MNDTIARLFEWMQIISNIAAARKSGEITEDAERELVDGLVYES